MKINDDAVEGARLIFVKPEIEDRIPGFDGSPSLEFRPSIMI